MRHEGWHRALDVQLAAHKWVLTPEGAFYTYGFMKEIFGENEPSTSNVILEPHGTIDETAMEMAGHVAEVLWRGDTLYITEDMMHLIAQAAEDLPTDICLDGHVLLSRYGFCLFAEPVGGIDLNGKMMYMNALGWEYSPVRASPGETELKQALCIYFFNDPHTLLDEDKVQELVKIYGPSVVPETAVAHVYVINDGRPLPKNDEGIPANELVTNLVRFFYAMHLLSHQSIGEPVKMRPQRAQRRRVEREFPGRPESMITLITLRRKTVKHDDEPQKVEWSRRWIVRGHWRKQWYPSLKRHEWKYIHEYIKGPDDKPFMTGRRIFNFRR